LIVSNKHQYFLSLGQINSQKECKNLDISFLLEPIPKDTAAALALACMSLDKNELVLASPADHKIKNQEAYELAVEKAKQLANKNIILFGIKPKEVKLGLGYIKTYKNDDALEVEKFIEKPTLENAKKYIEEGNYFFNSGIFCFKVEVFLKELEKYAPEVYQTCKKAYKNANKNTENQNILKIKEDDMQKIPKISIDYALMEKTKILKVLPCKMSWSDIGNFDALYEELPKDKNNNTKDRKLIQLDSKNNLVYSDSRMIATLGIEDLLIIDTKDALLISKKENSQKLKDLVALVGKNSKLDTEHLKTIRPWGSYEILEFGQNFKIKKIIVHENKRLSLQKHLHRNEHWIVVSGTASIEIEGKKSLLRPNESTYIKMGLEHRLENKGKIPLVLIETQVGEYTGEDDIMRIDDDYGRENN